MADIYRQIDKALLGLYSTDRRFLEELQEVKAYYEFYEGRPEQLEDDLENDTGQLWAVKDRDYRPTREIRNLTKKLMKKQGRFMTSVQPTIVVKSVDGVDPTAVDDKRIAIEKILDDGKFWNKFAKAFMDCTIGKRVLLALVSEVDEQGKPVGDAPIKFRFYTMPEFLYEYDPNDCDKLIKVQIAYQDESTVGKLQNEQRWHKWIYEMRGETCWCTYMVVDGTNTIAYAEVPNVMSSSIAGEEQDEQQMQQVEIKQEWDTGLSCIPCKVIFNDGLTGDVRGHSDIKDLMDMQTDYNKTISDYRDSLRFAMFDQTVFTDIDTSTIQGVVIAPGAIMDVKTDQSIGFGSTTGSTKQGKVEKIGSQFTFQAAADAYLERLKKDMYECMEQPLPESLVNVASGKALRMLYDDLITRCEEKWQAWDEAIIWLIHLIEEVVEKGNLYPEDPKVKTSMALNTSIDLEHNYPIPDDEVETKTIAIKEVEANVRSKQSYIREYGSAEEADKEFDEILDEMDRVNMTQNSMSGLEGPPVSNKE